MGLRITSTRYGNPGASPSPWQHPAMEALEPRLLLSSNWTVLVYMMGDNDLSLRVFNDINMMERVNLAGSGVTVVVKADDAGETKQGPIAFDPLSLIPAPPGESPFDMLVVSPLEFIGERNMGEPSELEEFLSWGATNHPADNYWLVLWDHGDGRGNVGTEPEKLTSKEIRSAISDAGVSIDLVSFDACLMGMMEVAYELRDVASYMTGSEPVSVKQPIPGLDFWGFPYESLLGALGMAPTMSPQALASQVVSTYGSWNWTELLIPLAQSAIKLDQHNPDRPMHSLGVALDNLTAIASAHCSPSDWETVRTAAASAWGYGPVVNSDGTPSGAIYTRDLGQFLGALGVAPLPTEVVSAAAAAHDRLTDAVINNWHNIWTDGEGLAAFLPSFEESLGGWTEPPRWQITSATEWESFLVALARSFAPHFSDVRLTDHVDNDSDGFYSSLNLEVEVDANLAATGEVFVRVYGQHDDETLLVYSDPFTVTGTGSARQTIPLAIDGGVYTTRGRYDLHLQLLTKYAGTDTVVHEWTAGEDHENHPELASVPLESSGDDEGSRILADPTSVTVPEGGWTTFGVRMSKQPASDVTVSVSRSAGDNDITVKTGSSLVFTPQNWASYQTVTLQAAEDADTLDEEATILCSAPGFDGTYVTATENDNDSEGQPEADLLSVSSPDEGASFLILQVRYSDDTAIDASDIDIGDICVTGPGGYRQIASRATKTSSSDTSPIDATYRIVPPGGKWDFADNGTYIVWMEPNQVSDTGIPAQYVASGVLDTFNVALHEPQTDVPQATLISVDPVVAGAEHLSFYVRYSDDVAIEALSIDHADIQITRPGGITMIADSVSKTSSTDTTPIIATYRIPAPGGTWNAPDNGTYALWMSAEKVRDTASSPNYVPAGDLGFFHVDLGHQDHTPPSPNPSVWAIEPFAVGTTSIYMAAVTAEDPNGVEYYFEEISENPGGTDSDWQDSPIYINAGLEPDTTYEYKVMTRDKSPDPSPGEWSEIRSATTWSGASREAVVDGFEDNTLHSAVEWTPEGSMMFGILARASRDSLYGLEKGTGDNAAALVTTDFEPWALGGTPSCWAKLPGDDYGSVYRLADSTSGRYIQFWENRSESQNFRAEYFDGSTLHTAPLGLNPPDDWIKLQFSFVGNDVHFDVFSEQGDWLGHAVIDIGSAFMVDTVRVHRNVECYWDDVTIVPEGLPLPAPEMVVFGNGHLISDNDFAPDPADHTDFGSADVTNGSVTRTFTIRNTGLLDLNLTGDPLKVVITGEGTEDFEIVKQPESPVAANGGETTFDVTFHPIVENLREARIQIDNDDGGDDPYDFYIQGMGVEAPVATNDTYTTNEDTELLVVAPGVLGNDNDPPLTAELVDGPGNAAAFALNADGSFDYTPAAEYSGTDSFTYKASKSGVRSAVATVEITVDPVNDAPADIDLAGNSVAENLPVGTLVGTFTTTDLDVSDTHTYDLAPGVGDQDNASFTIDGDQLKTAKMFDYETKDSYNIRVRTMDADGLSYEETFTIDVADVDDEPPITTGWYSAAVHDAAGLLLEITDDGLFSEPRSDGINTLVVHFSEEVDLSAASVVFSGSNQAGAVDLSGITAGVLTRDGHTGEIAFSDPLPDDVRYAVRLDGVMDMAGNPLFDSNDRVMTALMGDANGDLKTDVFDLLYAWDYRARAADAGVEQMRSDVNCNGTVSAFDLLLAWDYRGHDATGYADPALPEVVEGVSASAASQFAGMPPDRLVDGSGLSDGTHSADYTDMWLSNAESSPWVRFDLGGTQTLISIHVWNYNQVSGTTPLTGRGSKTADVYVSTTGVGDPTSDPGEWTRLADDLAFAEATGQADYEGEDYLLSAAGVEARYVLLTDVVNWDGGVYTGLSEIRFLAKT